MTATLYGLQNCDTCRKARQWLSNAGIPHEFVDVREDGVATSRLADWVHNEGWQTLLNRRSRAWRELPESERTNLNDDKALALMRQHPTLIKRPVLELDTGLIVGFSTARYEVAVAGAD